MQRTAHFLYVIKNKLQIQVVINIISDQISDHIKRKCEVLAYYIVRALLGTTNGSKLAIKRMHIIQNTQSVKRLFVNVSYK